MKVRNAARIFFHDWFAYAVVVIGLYLLGLQQYTHRLMEGFFICFAIMVFAKIVGVCIGWYWFRAPSAEEKTKPPESPPEKPVDVDPDY